MCSSILDNLSNLISNSDLYMEPEEKPPDSPQLPNPLDQPRTTTIQRNNTLTTDQRNNMLTEQCRCGTRFEPYRHKTGMSKSCHRCLEGYREHERTRAKRNWSLVNRDQTTRQEWKLLNYDKMSEWWMKHRQNKKHELGIDEYRRRGAEYIAHWRVKNPERHAATIERSRNSAAIRLSSMKHQAKLKGVKWFLTDDYATLMINHPCFYCNCFIKGIKNSIDKIDNNGCYTISNCVSCCKICNYMKETLEIAVMLAHFNNILFHQGKISERCESVNFDVKGVDYNAYLRRAQKKGFEFSLTREDFNRIKRDVCYLCGTKNTRTHQNGIDRVDSNKGYTLENCKSCCGFCNYLKGILGLEEFLEHIFTIYDRKELIVYHATLIKRLGDNARKGYYELSLSTVSDMVGNLTESDIIPMSTPSAIPRMKVTNTRKLDDIQRQTLSKELREKSRTAQMAALNDSLYIRRKALINGLARMKSELALCTNPTVAAKISEKINKCQQELDSLNNG